MSTKRKIFDFTAFYIRALLPLYQVPGLLHPLHLIVAHYTIGIYKLTSTCRETRGRDSRERENKALGPLQRAIVATKQLFYGRMFCVSCVPIKLLSKSR